SIKNIEIDQLNMVKLWDIENPKLYEIKVKLLKDSKVIDEYKDTFGFREAEFRQDGFYLNGRRVKLVGLNRHQAYPYVGYAMPQRVQEKDAEILKYELGLNIVRTSHYPQSVHFLRKCDEIGLLVFEEIPGWQHIGDEAWQAESIKNVEEMIKRDYNRPSIVLWGVRINESQDSHDFYVKTNAMAKSLDPIRQTGGVRYLENSDFLEDVYTMNDFIHSGGEKVLRTQSEVTGQDDKVPYLVTEYNGHMYPTKSFDQECKKVEHAYRHLRVINEYFGLDEISGAIGWCAFDYNTHSSFGSGDKICYHGVSDMFRNPKYAAYSYASQKKVEEGVVLEPITLGAKGERDGGAILPFTVLTNCDYIKIFKDGIYIDTYYPNKEKFPNLPHPPIEVSHILSMDSEIPLTEEAKKEIKDFVLNKLKDSNLTNLAEEDFRYIEEFSERVNIPVFKIMSLVYKLAGGWGDKENSLIIKGFIGNKEVASKEIGELRSMNKLEVTPDDLELSLDKTSYDATRIVVKLLDNLGEVLFLNNDFIEVEIDGPLSIMGPSKFGISGGVTAFWVRTQGKKGLCKIKVKSMYFEEEISIEVK
ncbi:MAG: glycoside hydrolase family 2 TIM barrel-domain containing protein, partial [Clostridium perfringens]|nr:glycoside hydrolase family 2 TIM barrel-domain containing protein [Clostridium perfringens]